MSKYTRFEKVARRLYCENWAILPRMHAVISDIFQKHVTRTISAQEIELFGEKEELVMSVVDGVAVIPVHGVISKGINAMDRMSGATDVDEIGAMLKAAMADESVSAVVLDVDSPGGSVSGVPELAAAVAELSKHKPVIAATESLMASAAYWISAGARAIYATPSAEVGSIGVYLPILDESGAYAAAGYKMEVLRSAETPLKGAGIPGTALTPEQRADLQAGVDYLFSMFSGFVKSHRRVDSEAMRGQTLFGNQAKAAGLVDSIGGLAEAIRDAKKLAG